MKKYLLGAFSAIILLVAAAYAFLISGAMPVATKGPPLPLERQITRIAIHAALRGQTNIPAPFEINPKRMLSGAQTYAMNCGMCHGYPNEEASSIAKGLFPKPPQFFVKGDDVTDDPPGEIYWFVKNGVRLTGMPGFVSSLSDEDIWEVSLFLKNTDKLTPEVLDFFKD